MMATTSIFPVNSSTRKKTGGRRVSLFALLAAGVAFSALSPAHAQISPGAEPQKVEKRFEAGSAAPSSPPPAIPGPPVGEPSAGADLVEFTVKEIVVSGATAYSEDELLALAGDVSGKRITLADAQNIAIAVTRKYRTDGYILSQATVAQNEVKQGRLHILVNEGYISDVVIDGDHRETRGLVEGYAERIKADRPLNIKTLERYLLLTDDLPGATAKGVIRPSAAQPGASELVIVMAHDSYSGAVSADNRGTEFQGPEQYSAEFSANSVLGLYERTQIRGITTSPTKELRFFDLQHEEQVGTDGTRLLFIGSMTDSKPGDVLSPLDIDGDAESLKVRALHPFLRSRKENLFGRVSFDYRNSDTDVLGVQISEDRIRSLRLGAQYDFLDALDGVNLLDAELSKGLGIMNSTGAGLGRSRVDGEDDYAKLNLDLARLQNLSDGWSVLAQASGQYAFDPLLSAEEFSLGGPGFGRAYDPSELAADHGLAGKLEVRWGDAPGEQYLQSYQLYGFYDLGAVWAKDAPSGTDERTSLASTGVGVRANVNEHLSGNLEVGLPLTRDVSSEGDQDARVFASVTGRF